MSETSRGRKGHRGMGGRAINREAINRDPERPRSLAQTAKEPKPYIHVRMCTTQATRRGGQTNTRRTQSRYAIYIYIYIYIYICMYRYMYIQVYVFVVVLVI